MKTPRRDLILLKGVRLQTRAQWGAVAARSVDVRAWLDLGEAALHDRIERTVDYRDMHGRLLERAARSAGDLAADLARALLEGFPQIDEVEVVEDGGRSARLARGEGNDRRAGSAPAREGEGNARRAGSAPAREGEENARRAAVAPAPEGDRDVPRD